MNFHCFLSKKYNPNIPRKMSPSDRIKGRNEIKTLERMSLPSNKAYKPRIRNKPKRGSVSTENVSTKHKGENSKKIAPTIALLIFNFCKVLKVKNKVKIVTKTLKTFIPTKPNCAKGLDNKTKKGFAQ